jgi:hypothetical protein
MDPSEFRQRHRIRCHGCGQITPSYDIINYSSNGQEYRQFCSRCFNAEMAKIDGLEGFEHVKFEPVSLTDSTGEVHEFAFGARSFGTGVALDAFELRDGHPAGYEFQVIGHPEEDLLALLGRLIEKMRRALSIRHLTDGEYGLRISDHSTVRGRIAWDEAQNGRVPLLVIDGREIHWDEFGRMLMTFEGWQFKMKIVDPSEEL